MSKKQALKLLEKTGCSKSVIKHSELVSRKSKELAGKIKNNGNEVDVGLCEIGGLLHDIGRSRTHGVKHALEGGKILKNHPRLKRIAEVHIGGGLPEDEAEKLGLPKKDYTPETVEEKIVCYADKLVQEDNYAEDVGPEIRKLKKSLGENHPAIKRLKNIEKEVKRLLR